MPKKPTGLRRDTTSHACATIAPVARYGREAAAAAASPPCIADVGEDPLVVTELLVEIVDDFTAQPAETMRKTRARAHHERDGFAHVMPCLREERDVSRRA